MHINSLKMFLFSDFIEFKEVKGFPAAFPIPEGTSGRPKRLSGGLRRRRTAEPRW